MSNKFLRPELFVFYDDIANPIMRKVIVKNTKKDLNKIFKTLDIFKEFGVKKRLKDEKLLLINNWYEPWEWITNRFPEIDVKRTTKFIVSMFFLKIKDITWRRIVMLIMSIAVIAILVTVKPHWLISVAIFIMSMSFPKIRGIMWHRIFMVITIIIVIVILVATKPYPLVIIAILIWFCFMMNHMIWELTNREKFRKIKRESEPSRYQNTDYYYDLYSQAISGKLYYPIESLNRAKQLISLRIERIQRYDNDNYVKFFAAILTFLMIYYLASLFPWNYIPAAICESNGNNLLTELSSHFCSSTAGKILEWDKLLTLFISFSALCVSCLTFLIVFFKTLVEMMYSFLQLVTSNDVYHSKLKARLIVIDEVIEKISKNDK